MQGEPPTEACTPTGAVFLSYASQDAQAAQRICEALRAAGIEVWFDQSELRGGDAWDHKIRDQIHDCRLFIPVISANTERRDEGYFRREWSLAVDRTRDMVHKRTFLVPVVIDGTPERDAAVPDKFHELQWTRLTGGETPPAFVDRIRRLLTSDTSPSTAAAAGSTSGPISVPSARRSSLSKAAIWGAGAIAAASAYFLADKLWLSKRSMLPVSPAASTAQQTRPSVAAAAAFNPWPHSIAVLPFVNMSGNKDQEYFSDGITEELITALSQVRSLKVIARTSSFAFKGRSVDIVVVARTLNVGSILEGSVRRAGSKIRVTVQLIDGREGFHVWSQEYDRDLKNVLVMQSDIATAVAQQLEAKLLGDEPSKIEAGGTQNPQAYDAFLRAGEIKFQTGELDHAMALAEKATQLDPQFARGWALLSFLYSYKSGSAASAPIWLARALGAADTALRLAPYLPRAHAKMAWVRSLTLDWDAAIREVAAAKALDPNDLDTLDAEAVLNAQLGRWQDAIAATREIIERDPLSSGPRERLGFCLSATGRHREAEQVFRDIVTRWPLQGSVRAYLAQQMLFDHRAAEALTEAQLEQDEGDRNQALAMIYYALGRKEDSDRFLATFVREHASDDPMDIAYIHAYRRETDLAFQWLDRALNQHAPALSWIKANFAVFPDITSDPRYPQLLTKIGLPVT